MSFRRLAPDYQCRGHVYGFLVFWLQIAIELFALFHHSVCDQMYSLSYFTEVMVLFMVSLSSGFRWSSNHLLCSITVFVIKCTNCDISLMWWSCLWFPCLLVSDGHRTICFVPSQCLWSNVLTVIFHWSDGPVYGFLVVWLGGHRTFCFVPSQCLWSNVLTVIFHWCHGPVYGFLVFWLQMVIEPFALFYHSVCDQMYSLSYFTDVMVLFMVFMSSGFRSPLSHLLCFVTVFVIIIYMFTVIFHRCRDFVYGFLVFWLQIAIGLLFALFHRSVCD